MSQSRKPPVYRLHKPSGLGMVRLDGRDRYLGRHGTPESREKYHRLIAEWLSAARAVPEKAQARRDGPQPPPAPTVGELILAFWRHAEAHYRDPEGNPGDELDNLRHALKPLRRLYETAPAASFGPLGLRAVRAEMIRSGLARPTVNARINRIRRVFKWGASFELVPPEVVSALATVAGLQKGRTEAPETKGVPAVPIAAVEAALPFMSAQVAALVRVQLLTGCRPTEAMTMRGRDLTPGDPTWEYRSGSHKNSWRGAERVIPLGPQAVEVIRPFLVPDLDAYLFSPRDAVAAQHAARAANRKTARSPSEESKGRKRRKRRKGGPGSTHHRRYERGTYLQAVGKACDRAFPHPELSKVPAKKHTVEQRAELRDWRRRHRWAPLQLRHTAASLIRARYGLEAAQNVLGHAKPDTTLIYAERDLAKAREVMASIG